MPFDGIKNNLPCLLYAVNLSELCQQTDGDEQIDEDMGEFKFDKKYLYECFSHTGTFLLCECLDIKSANIHIAGFTNRINRIKILVYSFR